MYDIVVQLTMVQDYLSNSVKSRLDKELQEIFIYKALKNVFKKQKNSQSKVKDIKSVAIQYSIQC